MKGAAPEDRGPAVGASPALWPGANTSACLDPSPVGGGCVRGADGQEGYEPGKMHRAVKIVICIMEHYIKN